MSGSNIKNIILLGETGVGKSTSINALVNYIAYGSLNEAKNNDLLYYVPAKIFFDMENNERTVIIGSNANEVQVFGVSATQNPMSYLIEIGNQKFRIIDTPGIGDTRGLKYDEINADKLLQYISQLDYINAICILLRPNNSRLNVLFEYCIKHILARLDKSVKNNIIFLFTNSRASSYTPGDTLGPLKMILGKIASSPPYFEIPFNSNNIFCVDNESFRYLVGNSQGVIFPEEDFEIYEKSWNKSANTCKRMINYIMGLPKLPMIGTVTINEARRIIMRLAPPVGEMVLLFEKALSRLQGHEKLVAASQHSIDMLKDQLYIPVTTYKLGKKVTRRSGTNRSIFSGIGFSFIPPFITFNFGVQTDTVDDVIVEELIVPVEEQVVDVNIQSQLNSHSNIKEIVTQQMAKINEEIDEINAECDVVVTAAVKFTNFLKENAIVAYQDAFEEYFKHILQRELDKGHARDQKMVQNLQGLLDKYRVRKNTIHNVSAKEINDIMEDLFALKHCGDQLKYYYDEIYVFEDQEVYAITNSPHNQ